MENNNQIEELKKITDSKRVPNAIILYGLNNEKLKAALNFSKNILSLNLNSEKKQLSEMMCNKLSHPDFHLIFPIPSSVKKDENTYDFYARLEVDYINKKYNLSLPESEFYETIGGLIAYNTGEIPKKGEKIEIYPYVFTVTKVTSKKIEEINLMFKNEE